MTTVVRMAPVVSGPSGSTSFVRELAIVGPSNTVELTVDSLVMVTATNCRNDIHQPLVIEDCFAPGLRGSCRLLALSTFQWRAGDFGEAVALAASAVEGLRGFRRGKCWGGDIKIDLATEVRDKKGQSMRAKHSCMLLSHWHWIFVRLTCLCACGASGKPQC